MLNSTLSDGYSLEYKAARSQHGLPAPRDARCLNTASSLLSRRAGRAVQYAVRSFSGGGGDVRESQLESQRLEKAEVLFHLRGLAPQVNQLE